MFNLNSPHIVHKPWGKEVWLELNDKYCYKRIYINAGTKTSYQYHEKKLETNFIIEGTAEIWLENNDGVVEKTLMKSGDFFTVKPPRKHRVIAITDVILQEVSTPEVDDVIRISDDVGRGNGKIEYEHLKPVLCILTAGVGSRLENLSKHINKCLLPLDNKAIISHIIDKTPKEFEIVVALGYRGDMVKEYCQSAHPDRVFKFVEVDKYQGEGSGPAYSISKCKEYLQRPFIWVTGDTIIVDNDDLLSVNNNWLGVYPTSIPQLYSTVNVDVNINSDIVVDFKNKDENGYDYAFIGLAGVYEYEKFWEQLDIESGEIVSAYYNIDEYSSIKAKKFDWYDVGTIDNYLRSKKLFENSEQYSIPKTNGEFLYKVKDNFIKLSSDSNFIDGRIKRSDNLVGLIPKLNYRGNNLYSYNWIDGDTLYNCDDLSIWKNFLIFANQNLWERFELNESFNDLCKKFYYDKTMDRLKLFLDRRDESFNTNHIINGFNTSSIHDLLKSFDWEDLYNGIPTKIFHGDLQFDNVIYGTDSKFYLLDWRQDFAASIVGDVYYDLSKMYGGILMSYKLMKDDKNFSCFVENNIANYQYETSDKLNQFKNVYEEWIVNNNYDLNKVKLITSLIFLNMSALHEEEFGNLLFFKAKEMLQQFYDR
jgi:NDP-sugar pyrophosphorylase family protein/mannose-6-phosphate isomerase-like protein (cupin superfamily)